MSEELLAHFDGLQEGMPLAFWRLAEIFQYQVFEICKEPSEKEEAGRQNYLIPYMMNDAIEDYLILENCRIVGEAATEEQMGELELSARISGEEGNYVLVVRQRSLSYGEENVFTLYFETLRECRTCYQYHAIGHFWMEGQEQWRRLVYMAGTIYDKFAYVGEEVCTEGELMLLRLAEFAPFRNWSPVRESLEEKYPATYEGIDCMEQFALRTEEKLLQSGFVGTYPDYQNGEFTVTVVEEHPFTVMEWEHFRFRIYYMVSQVKERAYQEEEKRTASARKRRAKEMAVTGSGTRDFFMEREEKARFLQKMEKMLQTESAKRGKIK